MDDCETEEAVDERRVWRTIGGVAESVSNEEDGTGYGGL